MGKKNLFVPEIRIPVGNSNFREIREENFYYVDKTGFILVKLICIVHGMLHAM